MISKVYIKLTIEVPTFQKPGDNCSTKVPLKIKRICFGRRIKQIEFNFIMEYLEKFNLLNLVSRTIYDTSMYKIRWDGA